MLKTRVITAIIGFMIAFSAITIGGPVYDVLIILLALLGWHEYVMLGKASHVQMLNIWGYITIVMLMFACTIHQYVLASAILVLSLIINYILCTFSEKNYTMASVSYSISGLLYVGIGMLSLLMIRHDTIYMNVSMPMTLANWGTITLWLLLFTTWASDTFAYFIGRLFGKRKIVPSISPNKTLEGFIGGFIGCIITGAIFSYIVGIPLWIGIHVGIISGIFAPLGDLFESKIKRLCNVKDSGTLLPGHGGVLDRFDSLLFTAPITLIYILLFS